MRIGIYIPGLGNELGNCSMASYLRSYAEALDKNDTDGDIMYFVKFDTVTFNGFAGKEFKRGVIFKQNKKYNFQNESIICLYEFDYEPDFTASYTSSNVVKQSARLSWGMIKMLPVMIRSFFYGPGLSVKQRFQSIYLFIIMCMIAVAMVMLLPSLFALLASNFSSLKDLIYQYALKMGFDIAQLNVFKKASEVVIIVSGSVAVLFPALQKIIRATAQEYLCIHYYLKYGECKQEITGKLSSLIKEVAKYNSNITEVEIHTYSFGGILAIDTFFPKNNQPIDKSVSEKVTHLVTVACPFDFLRVYYKHYFENRNNNNTSIKQWVNVFNKLDVLSSNFRNDTKTERSEDKISPGGISILNIEYEVTDTGQINWMDYLFLLSMKSHRMYWNDEPNSNSFFTNYLASNTLSA